MYRRCVNDAKGCKTGMNEQRTGDVGRYDL